MATSPPPHSSSDVLVIFDLNGTLCSLERTQPLSASLTSSKHRPPPAVVPPAPPDFVVGDGGGAAKKNVYVRPFLHTMLEQVTAEYDVAVWSCNTARYARPATHSLFRSVRQPVFVWCNDQCEFSSASSHVPSKKRHYTPYSEASSVGSKNLDRPELDPWQFVVLVDDTMSKFSLRGSTTPGHESRRRTVIAIPEFDRVASLRLLDTALLDLKHTIDAWVVSARQEVAAFAAASTASNNRP